MKKPSFDNTVIVAKFVVGHCTRAVVATAIANVVPTENRTQKVQLAIGTYAIAGVVGDAAKQWFADEINDVADVFKQLSAKKDATEVAV